MTVASGLRGRSPRVRVDENSKNSQVANTGALTVRDGNKETNPTKDLRTKISAQELSLLRAKTYNNTTTVQGKKVYLCNYCSVNFHLFTDLKLHIGKNHLEREGSTQEIRRRASLSQLDKQQSVPAHDLQHSQHVPDFQVENREYTCSLCKSSYPSKSSALKHAKTKKHLKAKENITDASCQVPIPDDNQQMSDDTTTTEKKKRGRPPKQVREQNKPDRYDLKDLREKVQDKDCKIKELQDRLETYDKLSKLRDAKSEDLVSRLEKLKDYVEESSKDRYLANKINDIYTDVYALAAMV